MSGATTPDTVIHRIVDAMRTLAGSYPGFRPVHANGVVCSGAFRGSAGASGITRAPHFAGQSVSTIVRFSNSSGDPDVHDGAPLPTGRTASISPTIQSCWRDRRRTRYRTTGAARACEVVGMTVARTLQLV